MQEKVHCHVIKDRTPDPHERTAHPKALSCKISNLPYGVSWKKTFYALLMFPMLAAWLTHLASLYLYLITIIIIFNSFMIREGKGWEEILNWTVASIPCICFLSSSWIFATVALCPVFQDMDNVDICSLYPFRWGCCNITEARILKMQILLS